MYKTNIGLDTSPALHITQPRQLMTIDEINRQLSQDMGENIDSYFEFFTGRKKADLSDPVDMWVKNRIIPITLGGANQIKKEKHQCLLNIETLIVNVDRENTLALLCRGYQVCLHRKIAKTDGEDLPDDEREQIEQAEKLFADQLALLLKKHPELFQCDLSKVKFNSKHVSRSFREELLRSTPNADNAKKIIKLLAFGGAALSVGLSAFAGYQYGYRQHLDLKSVSVVSFPESYPQYSTFLFFPLPTHSFRDTPKDIVEIAQHRFLTLRDKAEKLPDLHDRLSKQKIEIESLKNNTSEEGQYLYRQKVRQLIQERFQDHNGVLDKYAIGEFLEIMELPQSSQDYQETYALAIDVFTRPSACTSLKYKAARDSINNNFWKYDLNFVKQFASHCLGDAASVAYSKQLYFNLFGMVETNRQDPPHALTSIYADAANAIIQQVDIVANDDKRQAILTFLDEWLTKYSHTSTPEADQAAEKALLAWQSDNTSNTNPLLDSISNKLILSRNDTLPLTIKLLNNWLNPAHQTVWLPIHVLAKSLSVEHRLKEHSPEILKVLQKSVENRPVSGNVCTRLLSFFNSGLPAALEFGAAKIVFPQLALDCTSDALNKIKEILVGFIENGKYDLAKEIATIWSTHNHPKEALELFLTLVQHVPPHQVPEIGNEVKKIISKNGTSLEFLSILEEWSKKVISNDNEKECAAARKTRDDIIAPFVKEAVKRGFVKDVQTAFRMMGNLLHQGQGFEIFKEVLKETTDEKAPLVLQTLLNQLERSLGDETNTALWHSIKEAILKWSNVDNEKVTTLIVNILKSPGLSNNQEINHFRENIAIQWLKQNKSPPAKKIFDHLFSLATYNPKHFESLLHTLEYSDVLEVVSNMVDKHACSTVERKSLIKTTLNLNKERAAELAETLVAKGLYDIAISYASDILTLGEAKTDKEKESQLQLKGLATIIFQDLFKHGQGFVEFEAIAKDIKTTLMAEHAVYIMKQWIDLYPKAYDYKKTSTTLIRGWTNRLDDAVILSLANSMINEGYIEPLLERITADLKSQRFIAIDFCRSIIFKRNTLKNHYKFLTEKYRHLNVVDPVLVPVQGPVICDALTQAEACATYGTFNSTSPTCHQNDREKAFEIDQLPHLMHLAETNFNKALKAYEEGGGFSSIPLDWLQGEDIDNNESKFSKTKDVLFGWLDHELEYVHRDDSTLSKQLATFAAKLSASRSQKDNHAALVLYSQLLERGIWIVNSDGEEAALQLIAKIDSSDLRFISEIIVQGIQKGFIGSRDGSFFYEKTLKTLLSQKKLEVSDKSMQYVYNIVNALLHSGKDQHSAIEFIKINLSIKTPLAAELSFKLARYLDNSNSDFSSNLPRDWQMTGCPYKMEKAYELVRLFIEKTHSTTKNSMESFLDIDKIRSMVNEWQSVNDPKVQKYAAKLYLQLLHVDLINTFDLALNSAKTAIKSNDKDYFKAGMELWKHLYKVRKNSHLKNKVASFNNAWEKIQSEIDHASPSWQNTEILKNLIQLDLFKTTEAIAKNYKRPWWDSIGGSIPGISWVTNRLSDHKQRVERSLALFEALTSNQNYCSKTPDTEVLPSITAVVEAAREYHLQVPNNLNDILHKKTIKV